MIIAFWNINNKNLSDLLVEFVNEKQIDILVLAEANESAVLDFIIKQKKVNTKRPFSQISDKKVNVLSVFTPNVFKRDDSIISPRWDSFLLDIPTMNKLNLICVHFHSKVNWSDDSLSLECANLAKDIEKIENATGVFDTIIIGDFNMNPYESGLVAANGLHALPDLNYLSARPSGRKIDGIDYKYFYNPMWNFFGDKILPFGTHYYREPGHVSREWNIYDQVLYRPSLGTKIDNKKIEIVYTINGQNLINAMNRPDKDNYSDHLPILIDLNL